MNNVYTVPIPFASSPVVRGLDFFADINIFCWPCFMARPRRQSFPTAFRRREAAG